MFIRANPEQIRPEAELELLTGAASEAPSRSGGSVGADPSGLEPEPEPLFVSVQRRKRPHTTGSSPSCHQRVPDDSASFLQTHKRLEEISE